MSDEQREANKTRMAQHYIEQYRSRAESSFAAPTLLAGESKTMNTEYEYHAMAHWKKEAVKIIAAEPENHLDYHATILKHAHELGWLEALQWAASQIVPYGDPEVALEKINREIQRAVEPANSVICDSKDA